MTYQSPFSARAPSPFRFCAWVFIAAMVATALPGTAANKTWNGSASGNWNTAGNWDPAGVPANGDHLFFIDDVGFKKMTNNIPGAARRYSSLTFVDPFGYYLAGSPLVVSNGIYSSTFPNGYNTLEVDLTLGAAQTWFTTAEQSFRSYLTVRGDVNLNGFNLTLASQQFEPVLTMDGAISGIGNLTMTGVGHVFLEGTTANTYVGTMTVRDTFLRLSKIDNVTAVTGDLTIDGGEVVYFADGQIANTADIIMDGGLLNLNAHDDTVGALDLIGAHILAYEGGTLSMGGDLTTRASAMVTTIRGNLHLNGATRVFDVANGTASPDLDLQANLLGPTVVISNPFQFIFPGFIKTGDGTLKLSGTNTFAGDVTLHGGTLQLAATNNLAIPDIGALNIGDGDGTDTVLLLTGNQIGNAVDIFIADSGVLDLNNFSDNVGQLLFTGGTVNTGTGLITPEDITVNATDVSTVINGNLSLEILRDWTVGNGPLACDLTVNAVVSGPGGIRKNGTGTLCLNGANTFADTTAINAGQVNANHALALGAVTANTTVAEGATLLIGLLVNQFGEPLTLAGAGVGGTNGALHIDGTAILTNTITLSASATMVVEDAGTVFAHKGQITGAGSFTKAGLGDMTLNDPGDNNHTGDTIVLQGLLVLNKTATSVPHNLIISIPGGNSATAANLQSEQIDGGVTVNGGGLWNVSGFSETISSLTLNDGGDVQADAGGVVDLISGADVFATRVLMNGPAISGAGRLDLSGGTHTFTVAEGPSLLGDGSDLIISAHITGAGNLLKVGDGDLSLTASNWFTGVVTVDDGELRISDDFALGTTAGGARINNEGVLSLSGSIIIGDSLTLSSTGQGALGALHNGSGTNRWSGAVSLTSTARVSVNTNSVLDLAGIIGGAGGLTKEGSGQLICSGPLANTYGGVTTVNEGRLELRKAIGNGAIPGNLLIGDGIGGADADIVNITGSFQINDLSRVTVNSSGLLEQEAGSEQIGSLEGSGHLALGPGLLHAGQNNASTTFSGRITGVGGLTKAGTGRMILSGSSAYTGGTLVSAGFLEVNGSISSSAVTVNSNATFAGDGSVGNLTVNAGGFVGPNGADPAVTTGSLSAQNTVFAAGSKLSVELKGASVVDYDSLNINGTINLGNATLAATLNFAPWEGQVFTIVQNDGVDVVVGTFSGQPQGSLFNLSNIPFIINYRSGSGNDVTLTVSNLALRGAGVRVASGNGNGVVDANECNLLSIALENPTASAIAGITARLDTTTLGALVTQHDSAYPTIPALGFRTNSTAFQLRTLPDFECGQNIDLLLTVTAPGKGTFSIPFTLPTGVPGPFLTFNSTDVPKAIVSLQTATSLVIVTNGFRVGRVQVSLHATHLAAGDLRFSLVSPTGTVVALSTNHGGTGDNYGSSCSQRTTFDDAAATRIAVGTAPFFGTFAPDEPLAALVGEGAQGTWRLLVADSVAGNDGGLRCWSLFLAPAGCTDGGGDCQSCLATVHGTMDNSLPTMPGRLEQVDARIGTCAGPNICSGVFEAAVGPFRYRQHTFANTGPETCVSVVLRPICAAGQSELMATAYLGAFNPADLCAGFLGYSGRTIDPATPLTFSFSAPAASSIIIVVNEIAAADGCGSYTLEVHGLPCPDPTLNIAQTGNPNQVRLFWSTAYPDFQLQKVNTLFPPAGPPYPFINVPGTPVVVGGNFTVTNAPSGFESYYRLRKP